MHSQFRSTIHISQYILIQKAAYLLTEFNLQHCIKQNLELLIADYIFHDQTLRYPHMSFRFLSLLPWEEAGSFESSKLFLSNHSGES